MDAPAPPATPATPTYADFFASLRFRWPWRPYQEVILERFEARDRAKRTFHVVAPPGSGKTIIGLEIARRIGRPAVTFSPTTTIQEQWAEKVPQFRPEADSPEESSRVLSWVSTEPAKLGALSSLTYQSLATQTQEREFLDRIGRQGWIDELVAGGRSPEGAAAYLDEIGAKAPDVLQGGVSNRARARKRELLASGKANLRDLLHPNALDLLDRIVANGTGCVILDEAHHLLDYWAIILADLIRRLPDVLVVGLTATPPASADPGDMANYLVLVDGIDFEVPTPAVVKAGSLAPYQDMVLITRPTDGERAFLRAQHDSLAGAIAHVFADPRFTDHIDRRINRPPDPSGARTPWRTLLDEEFDLAIAGTRLLRASGRPLAEDVEIPDIPEPLGADDRLVLVREWCYGFLRLSPDLADRSALADLRAALRALGLIMTETGWRPAPSPVDRVLSYSASKVAGMVEILRAESAALGDRLRAVVLTDFERSSATALRHLASVLDPESGGAVRAIRALAADPATGALDPVMLTARTVLVDADFAPRFLAEARAWLAERGLAATLEVRDAGNRLALIEGSGGDWGPRHYVALVTDLFERGVTRCLVGTRGLLSEGWDSLTLNTLVDLTTAGTFASVNQIRGRSIRLDPNDPRKVADNWDVVCLAPDLEEGDRDLRRLAKKHHHVWGLGPDGRIVRGVGHVDHRVLLAVEGFRASLPVHAVNQRSLRRAAQRDRAYDAWDVGGPYRGESLSGTVVAPDPAKVRTAFTWKKSLRALLNLVILNLVFYALVFAQGLPNVLGMDAPWWVRALMVGVLVLMPFVVSAPLAWRYVRAAFIDLPVDSYLADFGRAVTDALHATGLGAARPEQVRATEGTDGVYEVALDGTDPATATAFAAAVRELFLPIVDQRYLVTREEAALSGSFYRPVWYVLRGLFRVFRRRRRVYHPVPAIFGRKRETAEAFGAAWKRWVGGGELVYTRSPEGAAILLRERAAGRARTPSATVEEWV